MILINTIIGAFICTLYRYEERLFQEMCTLYIDIKQIFIDTCYPPFTVTFLKCLRVVAGAEVLTFGWVLAIIVEVLAFSFFAFCFVCCLLSKLVVLLYLFP